MLRYMPIYENWIRHLTLESKQQSIYMIGSCFLYLVFIPKTTFSLFKRVPTHLYTQDLKYQSKQWKKLTAGSSVVKLILLIKLIEKVKK